MVVTGVGVGSGNSKSMTRSPLPAAIRVAAAARGRTLQQPGTGSQKYSSSVMPVSRGRNDICQYHSSWSMASCFQSSAMGAFYRSAGRVRDRAVDCRAPAVSGTNEEEPCLHALRTPAGKVV